MTMLIARDPWGQRSAAPPPPPPPDSAPVSTLPPRPPDQPPHRRASKTVSSREKNSGVSSLEKMLPCFLSVVYAMLAMEAEPKPKHTDSVCVFQPNLEGYEIHEVPLTKKDGQSLGISIIGYNALTSQGRRDTMQTHVNMKNLRTTCRGRTGNNLQDLRAAVLFNVP